MKSDLKPEQITEDVIKALQQVTVSMSFEEFLRKFFYMWSDDAELLAKLLGFETELENEAAETLMMSGSKLGTHSTEWLEWRMESISSPRQHTAVKKSTLLNSMNFSFSNCLKRSKRIRSDLLRR